MIKKKIEKNVQNNRNITGDVYQNCDVNNIGTVNIMSVDYYKELIKNENYKAVETDLNSIIATIAGQHPLAPHYRFETINNKDRIHLLSRPNSKEAMFKYPPKIQCDVKVKVGNKYVNQFNENVKLYADRHQLPMEINILAAKKFLGDSLDPIQTEAEELVGKTKIIYPTPFPEAIPCNVLINDEIIFDYILLTWIPEGIITRLVGLPPYQHRVSSAFPIVHQHAVPARDVQSIQLHPIYPMLLALCKFRIAFALSFAC